MVERGDATAEDIDTAMELGAGYRELISSFWEVVLGLSLKLTYD